MKIVADENIPYIQAAFAPLGQVVCVPGRSMTPAILHDADALLVRSVTQVGPALLDDTPVRFVGTATIGTDHIDLPYLARRNIRFTDAAGSNANSVAEYVLTALLTLAQRHRFKLNGKTLGIVGVGNIGSKIEKYAPVLGLQPLPNDPPLQRLTGDKRYVSLDEALAADIVTLHVPLTRQGPDATYHLINKQTLGLLGPKTILINASRGAVVDNQALNTALAQHQLGPTVLDVWENEPTPNLDLLQRVALATPHIAGYSLDGKVKGTLLLHQALCDFLNVNSRPDIQHLLPPAPVPQLTLDTSADDEALLTQAFQAIYDINRDDSQLRGIAHQPANEQGAYFDRLRKQYSIRREAPGTRIHLQPQRNDLAHSLSLLGFCVEETPNTPAPLVEPTLGPPCRP